MLPVLYPPIPHDEYLEDRFIGGLVLIEQIPPEIDLSLDEIHNHRNRWIYGQFIEMARAGIPLQAPAICKYLCDHKRYKPEIDIHLVNCVNRNRDWFVRTGDDQPLERLQRDLRRIAFEKKREIAKHEVVSLLLQNNFIGARNLLDRLLNEVQHAD